jgi:hypothetical protein
MHCDNAVMRYRSWVSGVAQVSAVLKAWSARISQPVSASDVAVLPSLVLVLVRATVRMVLSVMYFLNAGCSHHSAGNYVVVVFPVQRALPVAVT